MSQVRERTDSRLSRWFKYSKPMRPQSTAIAQAPIHQVTPCDAKVVCAAIMTMPATAQMMVPTMTGTRG